MWGVSGCDSRNVREGKLKCERKEEWTERFALLSLRDAAKFEAGGTYIRRLRIVAQRCPGIQFPEVGMDLLKKDGAADEVEGGFLVHL